jgi:purine-binding chemotaxis protein CheW
MGEFLAMDPTSLTATPNAIKLLIMHIGGEEYCVDIMKVREIRGWSATTCLPLSPSYVLGVVNLRGTAIPVIDLAVRLGLPRSEPSARDAIVVAQIRDQLVGLLVQGVSDMVELGADRIQPTPDMASGTASYVLGLIALEKRLISLLSLDKVLPTPVPMAA